MSDANIYVSNGTCYSGTGKKLDGSFIPCGNDAFGHQTCCGAGDNCLADGSCWGQHGSGYGSSLTYMAGCSDPDYKDASCPNKHIDQDWIALTLCDNSGGQWAVCSQKGDPTTLQPGSYCSCTDASKTTIAFSDATSLTSSCSLPKSTGESIQFFAGHIPSAPAGGNGGGGGSSSGGTTTGGGSGTGGATGGSSSGTATQTGSSPSNSGLSGSGSSTGLSSGAKIGIGVGVAVGGLILLAVIAALFYLRRKRRRSPAEVEGGGKRLSKPERASALSTTPTVSEKDGRLVSEADGRPAQPWTLRSELEDTHVAPSAAALGGVHGEGAKKSSDLSPVAELPGRENEIPARGLGKQIPPQGMGLPAVDQADRRTTPVPGAEHHEWGSEWRRSN